MVIDYSPQSWFRFAKETDIALQLSAEHLLNGKYILAQKGKKNYYILKFE